MHRDIGNEQTDKILAKIQRRVEAIYRQAFDEMDDRCKKQFAYFEREQNRLKKLLEDGKITESEYKTKCINFAYRSEHMKQVREVLATRLTDANEVAIAYINDATPTIYSLNHNWTAYTIESVSDNVAFNLFDEQTVKRLVMEKPDVMPFYPPERAVERGIDLAYGKSQITSSITSGILQGKSIPRIQQDLLKRIKDMGDVSAMRAARTAVTAAQNAGRMACYKQAEDMGIKIRRQWMCTKDTRTRDSHRELDGETINGITGRFSNGLRYPGDPQGKPSEVYNCRCTLVTIEETAEPVQMRARDPQTGRNEVVDYKTFRQWEEEKLKQGDVV